MYQSIIVAICCLLGSTLVHAIALDDIVVYNQMTLAQFEPGDEVYDAYPVVIQSYMGEIYKDKSAKIAISANCANNIKIIDNKLTCIPYGTGTPIVFGMLLERQNASEDYMTGFSFRRVYYSHARTSLLNTSDPNTFILLIQ